MPVGHVVCARGRATAGSRAMYGSSRAIVAGFGRATCRCGSATPSRAPSRARAGSSAAGCGSWTMHDVPAAGELARVHLVVAPPGVPLLVGEVLGRALQRVVHELRRVEELLAPVDDLPLALEPDVLHERDERVEDLGDAAAERGRRDVHDARALQRLGELADLLDRGRGRRCACSRRASCEPTATGWSTTREGTASQRRLAARGAFERALAELHLDASRARRRGRSRARPSSPGLVARRARPEVVLRRGPRGRRPR